MDYCIPRKGRFSAADIGIKKPGYLLASQMEEMNLTTRELINLVDHLGLILGKTACLGNVTIAQFGCL